MYCEICGKWSGKYNLCKSCYFDEDTKYDDDDDEEDVDDDSVTLPFDDFFDSDYQIDKCPICGEPTSAWYGNLRKDGLCRKHAADLKARNIRFDEKSKVFYDVKTSRALNQSCNSAESSSNTYKNDSALEAVNSNDTNIVIDKGFRCITCGYETDGKLFCAKCYSKYCKKEILIKIKNCREIVPLDDFYEGYYECDDGHVVKSMAERDIDDYLFSHNIKHGYEVPLIIKADDGRTVTLHPDFCIFDENSNPVYYIEYWGFDDNNKDYTKTKKFKLPLYEKAKITLININAKTDLRNLKNNLSFKMQNYEIGKINFVDG